MGTSTAELDELLIQIRRVRAEKAAASEVVKSLNAKKDELEGRMIAMLKEIQKKNWQWQNPENGKTVTFSIAETMSVRTPKTIEDKKALWDYFVSKYGEDAAFDKFGVNANTLNAFYNQEWDSIPDSEKALWSLPGCGEPTMYEEPRLRET